MHRLATLFFFLLILPFAGWTDDAPVTVTTDTADYCTQLEVTARGTPDPPAEARELITAGQHLCDQGHVRGGIERLRRALVIMHKQQK